MKSAALILALGFVSAGHDKARKVKLVKAKEYKHEVSVVPIDQSPVEMSCELGYDLEGDFCVRVVEGDLLPFCPRGELRGDECLLFAPPRAICPDGSILLGDLCSRTITADADLYCPPDYEMMRGKHREECRREIMNPPVSVCPPGSEEADYGCIMRDMVDFIPECPDGAVLIDGHCVTERTFDCTSPAGKVKHGKGGHHRMLKSFGGKGKGKKEYEFVHIPTVVTEVVAQECRESVMVEPRMICPFGAELRMGSCYVERPVPHIERHVPPSFDIVPVVSECPALFTMCGGKGHHGYGGCCRHEEDPAEHVCPPGMMLDGLHCVEYLPVDHRCADRGFVRRGDLCVREDRSPPVGIYSITYECRGMGCGPFGVETKKVHGGGHLHH